MLFRIGVLATLATLAVGSAALAGGHPGAAPADEYFGRYRVSPLGVVNLIRDAGTRIDERGANGDAMLHGALAFASDALAAWEREYPADPWIPRELLNLQRVYARIPGADAAKLVARTEAWLVHDYPGSPEALSAAAELADASGPATAGATTTAWERFAALRAPLPAGSR